MKYFLTAFITGVLVFLGATVYYKGLPDFVSPRGISTMSRDEPTEATPNPNLNNPDACLLKAVRAALVAIHGQSALNLNVDISEFDGDYARGTIIENGGGGGLWFATRVNDIWALVWDGNGIPDCVRVNLYPKFPNKMIPQCFNAATGEIIVR